MHETRSKNTELTRIRKTYENRDQRRIYSMSDEVIRFHVLEREYALGKLFDKLSITLESARVLDVGCGAGSWLSRLRDYGVSFLSGVDLMYSRLVIAKENYSGIGFVNASGDRLPYRDGEFDIVFQFMCLSSVLDKDLRKDIVKEMMRVLKPGGVLVLYDLRELPLISRGAARALSTVKSLLMRGQDKGERVDSNVIRFSKRELQQEIGNYDAYFKPISTDLRLIRLTRWSAIVRGIIMAPSLFKTHYAVVVRKENNVATK